MFQSTVWVQRVFSSGQRSVTASGGSVRSVSTMARSVTCAACAGGMPSAAAALSCDAVLRALPALQPAAPDGGVAALYRLPDAQGCVGLIRPVSRHFCAACNRLRLTADGKLKPCLHSSQEYSLRGLSEDAMRAQFLRAVAEKPAQHAPLDPAHQSGAGRQMNEIGG